MKNTSLSEEQEEISIKDIIITMRSWVNYFLKKWLFIVFFGIAGAVSGFLYAYLKPAIFTATTTFVLEDEKSGGGLGSLSGLASLAGVDLGGGGGGIFQGDNIFELYKSRTMIERTLLSPVENDTNQLVIDLYISVNKLREGWKKKPALKNLNFSVNDFNRPNTRVKDSVLGTVVKTINGGILRVSKPDKKLSIIRVDVNSESEIFAKVFNNKIVETVNEFYKQTKTKKSIDNVAIIKRKTDSVRAVMNGAIFTAANIADETPNLNPTRQVQRVVPMQRSQFTAETNKSVLGELVKNLEMSQMALLKETPLIQIVDIPKYPLQREKLAKSKAVIVGGLIFGLISLLILTIKKVYTNIINE